LALIIALSIGLSDGTMSYNIGVSVGGSSWRIDHFTQNAKFDNTEYIYGWGNFSRINFLNPNSDHSLIERSSAFRGGNLSLEGTTGFESVEGPVAVAYSLYSLIDNANVNESATIKIDESWPSILFDNKKVQYSGRGIKTLERYDNNGDIISTFSDSYSLQKESAYASVNNRTRISTTIYPNAVYEDRISNKTSAYQLRLKSVGALSTLDVIKTRATDEKGPRVSPETISISQEYRGSVDMSLKIINKENIIENGDNKSSCVGTDNYPCWIDDQNFLPCAMSDYSGLGEFEREPLGADILAAQEPSPSLVPPSQIE
jgi:hypothetical protein